MFIKLITLLAALKMWSPTQYPPGFISAFICCCIHSFHFCQLFCFSPVLSCLAHDPCFSFSSLSHLLCVTLCSPPMCSDPHPPTLPPIPSLLGRVRCLSCWSVTPPRPPRWPRWVRSALHLHHVVPRITGHCRVSLHSWSKRENNAKTKFDNKTCFDGWATGRKLTH